MTDTGGSRVFKSEALWSKQTIEHLLKSLVRHHWQSLRPGQVLAPDALSDPEQSIISALGADSLEIYQLATAAAVFFELHQTGVETQLLDQPSIAHWQSIVSDARGQYDETLVFSTSGSTGQPKFITHRLPSLLREAEFWSKALPRSGIVLASVPCHHLYGFIFTQLLPKLWNARVVDCVRQPPTALKQYEHQSALLVGFPTYWQTLVNFGVHLPHHWVGINSTAPCSPTLVQHLYDLGLQHWVDIYGSSETAAVGWRSSTTTAYTLLPWWTFENQNANKLVRSETGEVIELQDDITLDADRSFFVTGRKDHAVQVGGVNVYPNQVAQQLRQIRGVKEVQVRLMKPTEGERLKAFVVPEPSIEDPKTLLDEIEQFCDRYLKPVERPKSVRYGRHLPVNSVGKLTDWDV